MFKVSLVLFLLLHHHLLICLIHFGPLNFPPDLCHDIAQPQFHVVFTKFPIGTCMTSGSNRRGLFVISS